MSDAARRGIQPELFVRNGRAAVEFYQAGFGATVLFRFGDHADTVAQLAVGDAVFWVEDESPAHGNVAPPTLGGTATRTLLISHEPERLVARAIAAGASELSPVGEENGWLLGRIEDPFGHRWEIGRPLGGWPPSDGPA